jgi:hypothetical protein
MTRFKAFLVHLGISAALFAALAAMVFFVWYPGFFFEADGGWQGLRIILLVDLVAGPLLTLIVYKPGKPSLRTDLTIIAVFQAICLAGGTWVVFNERPIALVYSDGAFFSMTAEDYREAGVDPADLNHIPGPWPKRVAVVLPTDPAEQSDVRREAFGARRGIRTLTEYYVPLTRDTLQIEREAVDIDKLKELDRGAGQLPAWLDRHGGDLADYAFFPFGTRYRYIFLGVRRADGAIVGALGTPGKT